MRLPLEQASDHGRSPQRIAGPRRGLDEKGLRWYSRMKGFAGEPVDVRYAGKLSSNQEAAAARYLLGLTD